MGYINSDSTNFGGHGGFGGFFGGGGGLTPVFDITRFFDGKGNRGDDDHRLCIIEAIKGNIEAVKEIARDLKCPISAIQTALNEARARIEANGVKIDCVGEKAQELLDRLDSFKDRFSDFKTEVSDAFCHTKDFIRDQLDKSDCKNENRFERVNTKLEKIIENQCKAEHAHKDEIIADLRENALLGKLLKGLKDDGHKSS